MARIDLEPLNNKEHERSTRAANQIAPQPDDWAHHDVHAEPPLYELLNDEEISMYSALNAHDRVMLASTLLVREFAKGAELPHEAKWFTDHVEKATEAWKACCRIRDNDVPFSFGHLYHLMLFVTFIFGTPIAIMCNEATGWWGLGLCAFAPFLVYALEIMADEMDNPFGWDTNDHDLTKYCTLLHRSICVILNEKNATSLPNIDKKGVKVQPVAPEMSDEGSDSNADEWKAFGSKNGERRGSRNGNLIKI